MVVRAHALCALALLAAGCTDVFLLPTDGGETFGDLAGRDFSGSDDLLDGGSGGDGDGSMLALPAACARLPCVPALNEGDVTLDNGPLTGCHAYHTLTITQVVQAGDSSGPLSICANRVVIAGSLSADGTGFAAGGGPGGGGPCGAGGSHGGVGADPTGTCGSAAYGSAMTPRELGSGGGGSGAGHGGGAIEIEADDLDLIGFITANGESGAGVAAGGGSGGSVLIQADTISGAGQVSARGGVGLGLGGGGGGGRIAIYTNAGSSFVDGNVKGGATMNGSGDGADGSYMHVP